MATSVSNIPEDLRVSDFLGKVNSLGGPAKGCRFAVRIMVSSNGSDQNFLNRLDYVSRLKDLVYVCDSVEFPGRSFGVTNIRYYGAGQTMPNNVEYGPCNLSFICNNQGIERQFFDDWQEIINPTSNFNYSYPNEYYCDIEIYQFSEYQSSIPTPSTPVPGATTTFEQISLNRTPQIIYNWKLWKCWPSLVNAQPVTWADNSDVLRLQVTLNYKYWSRPGVQSFATQRSKQVVANTAFGALPGIIQ